MSCRLHGSRCSTPWGYDRDYTDSDRPYTLDELVGRQAVPHFYAYPSADEYLLGWHTWRALRRDDELTYDESAVQRSVWAEHRGYGSDFFDLDPMGQAERLLAVVDAERPGT